MNQQLNQRVIIKSKGQSNLKGPYHGGRHYGGYNKFVDRQLKELNDDWKAGALSDIEVTVRMNDIANNTRNALLNEVRLQRNDPRPPSN